MIAGKDAPTHGEAKNSWLTGTAAWTYFTVTQWIFGVRSDYDGLRIDPCIPANWKGFKVSRIFRGEQFDIEVRNPSGVMKGVRRIVMDGVEIADQLIRPAGDGRAHTVVVEMG
jgi:cellobiose phosphorylase